MKHLLSLPPNATKDYHKLNNRSKQNWYVTSDPRGKRLGSGGGTTWLLEQCYQEEGDGQDFMEWLAGEKRILVHAGGQSRRLPAYAVVGKTSVPIPVFRWARGQRLAQDLVSLQLPFYERIMEQSPEGLDTLIVSGDVYIHTDETMREVPEADVVCYGLWVDMAVATRHGVFASERGCADVLDRMIQKPTLKELEELSGSHLFLMDVGVWLLSDRAVEVLRKRSYNAEGELDFYDLYGEFGLALGKNPTRMDREVNELTVKVVPLEGGEFYHYGTTREMIGSTLAIQNRVYDQRLIMHRKVKPNPALFTQNSVIDMQFTQEHKNIWIENSYVGKGWKLTANSVVTGVPENEWVIDLPDGICLDMVPVGDRGYVARVYGMDDLFKGAIGAEDTRWMNRGLKEWLDARGVDRALLGEGDVDLQDAKLFPYMEGMDELERVVQWMIGCGPMDDWAKGLWTEARRYSANELMDSAALDRLYAQREVFRRDNYLMLERNYRRSVFYQLDLTDVARDYMTMELPISDALGEREDALVQIHNRVLRGRLLSLRGKEEQAGYEVERAYSILRRGLIEAAMDRKRSPRCTTFSDQIVWGRSPVRIDLAGGWTDTPPFSLYEGGNVVNMAVELNGQPPLQVYVKPCEEYQVILRSIDMGATEVVRTYEELRDYRKLGSPFSIPKAALALCGFLPEYGAEQYASLKEQLKEFGGGIEVTLLAAIPSGSGLGTSSVLGATVLGALSDFCGLLWSKNEINTNTLLLEQLLTSGGGWQDQYGGILPGVKLLESGRGFVQQPQVSWLPNHLFTEGVHRGCHLLYYTGITRVAKNILGEIVENMFLNSGEHLAILHDMKTHALEMTECIQRGDFERYGRLIGKTWEQKKRLDRGTNPPQVQQIIDLIKDYTLGYVLPGAGGGGYLYMVAKDPEAAVRIQQVLNDNPPNRRARFVEMRMSGEGFVVSRS